MRLLNPIPQWASAIRPVGIFIFKVKNETCSKVTVKTPERFSLKLWLTSITLFCYEQIFDIILTLNK